MHSSGSTNGSSLADSPWSSCVGFSTGGRGVVEQALQQSQVYAATHLGVGAGQIPYRAAAQPNDPFPSDDLLAVSRQRCHWFGFSSQFGVEPHPVEDLGGERRSSIQRVTRRRSVRIILGRNGFALRIRDPAGPLHVRRAGHDERVFPPSLRAPSRESRRVSDSPGAPRRRGIRCVDDPLRPGSSGCVRSLPRRTTRPGGSARW